MTNSYPKPNKLYNEIFTFQKVQIKFKVKKSEVVSRRQNSKKKKIRNIKQTNFIQTVKNNREKKKWKTKNQIKEEPKKAKCLATRE